MTDQKSEPTEHANADQPALSDKMVSRLKLVSGLMGVAIIICFILLIYGLAQKAGELSDAPKEVRFTLPKDSQLKSVFAGSDGHMRLWLQMPDGDMILTLDGSGAEAGRVYLDR